MYSATETAVALFSCGVAEAVPFQNSEARPFEFFEAGSLSTAS
jgi:hypothetical protein